MHHVFVLATCLNGVRSSLQLLMDVAKHKNNNALPLIKPYTGPKLPPDRYCINQPNYRLKSNKKVLCIRF